MIHTSRYRICFLITLKQRTDVQLAKSARAELHIIISCDPYFLVDGAFCTVDFHRAVDYWNTLIVN